MEGDDYDELWDVACAASLGKASIVALLGFYVTVGSSAMVEWIFGAL